MLKFEYHTWTVSMRLDARKGVATIYANLK